MKNTTVETPTQEVKIPKAEAIEKFAKHSAAIKVQLEACKVQLKAAVSPEKYALNFQVNGFKKQLNFCKAQIARLKKEPKADVIWSDKFCA